MNTTKRCRSCNCIIDQDEHGNREYCNDICYYYQKKLRNHKKYQEQVQEMEGFQKTDLILETFFDLYGPEEFIPVIFLDRMGLDWDIKKKMTKINDQLVSCIRNYAYCLYTNHTVKIWKL